MARLLHYYQSTWNFKEGEKLLWFFGQAKKGVEKRHEHENHPTKVLEHIFVKFKGGDQGIS